MLVKRTVRIDPPQPNWHFSRTQRPVTTLRGDMTLAPNAPSARAARAYFSKTRPLAVPAPARLDRLAAGGGTADALTVSGAGAGGFVSPFTCALCRRLGLATTFLTTVADPRLAGLSRLPVRLFPARLRLADMPIPVSSDGRCDSYHTRRPWLLGRDSFPVPPQCLGG